MKRFLVCFFFCAVACCTFVAGCGGGTGKKTGTGGNGGIGGSTGSGGVNGDCSFTACGGNLVGTWNIESLCSPNASTTCAQPVTIDRSKSVATYTFSSNGTFTFAASGTLTETISYTADCLSAFSDAGVSERCTALQSTIQASIARADGGSLSELTSFTCSVQNDLCVCVQVIMPAATTETGTYTTSGNQVTITINNPSTDGGFPISDYCVSGTTLKIRSPSTSGSDIVVTLTR